MDNYTLRHCCPPAAPAPRSGAERKQSGSRKGEQRRWPCLRGSAPALSTSGGLWGRILPCHQHSTRQSRGRGATNMEAQIKDKQLLLPDSKAHNGWKKKARGLSGHLKPPRVCPAQVTCMKTKIIGKLHVWCWKANQQ